MQIQYRVSLPFALALGLTSGQLNAQLSVSSELQGAVYPEDAIGREARQIDFRGWVQADYKRTFEKGFSFRGDLLVYGPSAGNAFWDGTAALAWRGRAVEIAVGVLREKWGRFTHSDLD